MIRQFFCIRRTMWLVALLTCLSLTGCTHTCNSQEPSALPSTERRSVTPRVVPGRLPSVAMLAQCFELRIVPVSDSDRIPVVLNVEDELGTYHVPYDHNNGSYSVHRLVPLRDGRDQDSADEVACRSASSFRVIFPDDPIEHAFTLHFNLMPGENRSSFSARVNLVSLPCLRSSAENVERMRENRSIESSVGAYLAARRLYFTCREILNEGHIVTQRALRLWFDAAASLVLHPSWRIFGRDVDVERIMMTYLESEEPPRHFLMINPRTAYLTSTINTLTTLVWRNYGNVRELRDAGRTEEAQTLHTYFVNLYEEYDDSLKRIVRDQWRISDADLQR